VNFSWQVPGEPAGIAPPVRVTLPAVKPGVPPQVLETRPVACRFEGRLSVKLVSGMLYALLGLLSVMVAVRETLRERVVAQVFVHRGVLELGDRHALRCARDRCGHEVGGADHVVPAAAAVVGRDVQRDRAVAVHTTDVGRDGEAGDLELVDAARARARGDHRSRAGARGRGVTGMA